MQWFYIYYFIDTLIFGGFWMVKYIYSIFIYLYIERETRIEKEGKKIAATINKSNKTQLDDIVFEKQRKQKFIRMLKN